MDNLTVGRGFHMEHLVLCRQRKKLYELLSYCLLNIPRNDLLQTMIKGKEIFEELAKDNSNLNYSFEPCNLEQYIQEYYDRFFVPSSPLFIPPYEAAIRNRLEDGNKIIYGKLDSKETFHVKACYEMLSFNPQTLNMFEPLRDVQFPDHIAFEMAFITFLVFSEEEAWENGEEEKAFKWRNLQHQFIEEHLNKWISDFATLAEEKGSGLYSYLLRLCAIWIEEDNNFLIEELVD